MKIACIATSQVPSNTANSIQAMKVSHALAQLGHTVTLLLPDGHHPGREEPAARHWEPLSARYGLNTPFDITWIPAAPAWKRYDFAWKAVHAARQRQADLVYTWTAQASLLALIHGLPAVLEVHDRLTGRLGPLVFRFYRRWPGKKRTLAITQALARVLEREYGGAFPAGELKVASNGVDLEHYAHLPEPAAARRVLGLPEAITAVYTGHFYTGRGTDILLGLALRYPQVRFLWVGGREEDVERWRTRLKQAMLSNVTLTGFVDNRRLPLYQAAGDILLMPYEQVIAGSSGGNSADICSPMKMFDYLAAGRAIISSDLPVIREVLNEGNACFCPPGDVKSWQTTLGALLEDPLQRLALANQAKADAQRYGWTTRELNAIEGLVP